MTESPLRTPSEQLVSCVVNGVQNVKGEEITVLDLREVPHAVADYFVICHGNSYTQVNAIARSVEAEALSELEERPWHREGYGQANWVLLDFSNVVVHVFYKESRSFYALEELWADASFEQIEYTH